jgi:hypothetical protein
MICFCRAKIQNLFDMGGLGNRIFSSLTNNRLQIDEKLALRLLLNADLCIFGPTDMVVVHL